MFRLKYLCTSHRSICAPVRHLFHAKHGSNPNIVPYLPNRKSIQRRAKVEPLHVNKAIIPASTSNVTTPTTLATEVATPQEGLPVLTEEERQEILICLEQRHNDLNIEFEATHRMSRVVHKQRKTKFAS
ncbi:hypothetical protein RclHR1_05470006 [Rhizophagus clarus]|uniref:Uncharacterized protein n=1 Tax=Rhizophagus clarus TaxID=94130 RepID=A0A2Z6RZV4_9GLOM|nr:hypothetical protein RclHR1_05470006 [Rhizophagus clarus]GES83859.1 hypothetical protein RCL_jg738.t1 [Rhizophagus clarus]